jgi:hypothetical protein
MKEIEKCDAPMDRAVIREMTGKGNGSGLYVNGRARERSSRAR